MGRRSDHSREEFRELALSAAERITAAQGQRGLSARKVAAEIGYTVGSLYLVFENLDDLIVQVNERTLDALSHTLRASIQDCTAPQDCLLALGRAYIDFAIHHPNRWKMVFEHRMPPGQPVPDSFIYKVSQMFDLLKEQLERLPGQHSPEQIALAASALWSGVHGVGMLSLDQKLQANNSFAAREVAEALIEHYLRGFTAPAPYHSP